MTIRSGPSHREGGLPESGGEEVWGKKGGEGGCWGGVHRMSNTDL